MLGTRKRILKSVYLVPFSFEQIRDHIKDAQVPLPRSIIGLKLK